ncbi:phage tail terminator protein [Frigidibacter oleivorans]|uniref:phage tail terminator protein n=1 Tax=Frigidibacter oleivorans TaxID=2487129 RepID=UPI000F8CA52A|nr:hypothetical protein [Frigidibacter oleivorans]
MLVQDIIARLGDRVVALAGRIRAAEDYAALLQMKGISSAQGGAYVMPSGIRGGRVESATGVFTQIVDEVIAVVILVPAERGLGRQGATIESLKQDVIQALCGWVPEEAIGPFQLVRGAMINLGEGALAFQLEFSVPDQLRIIP